MYTYVCMYIHLYIDMIYKYEYTYMNIGMYIYLHTSGWMDVKSLNIYPYIHIRINPYILEYIFLCECENEKVDAHFPEQITKLFRVPLNA
jgi:hypothetical protein